MRFILLIIIALITPAATSTAHSLAAHKWIACQALSAWRSKPAGAFAEFDAHMTCSDDRVFSDDLDESLHLECFCAGKCADYDRGDDLISGAAEEDGMVIRDRRNRILTGSIAEHLWNPDVADTTPSWDSGTSVTLLPGDLLCASDSECHSFGGSYRRALTIWKKAVKLYNAGKKTRAYYELGRVAHLLTDATVPAHVHLDNHPGHGITDGSLFVWSCGGGTRIARDDAFEKFFGRKKELQRFFADDLVSSSGLTEYRDEQLLAEQLAFSWNSLDAAGPAITARLFKLFWYTAQKTQYYASDGDGVTAVEQFIGDGGIYRDGNGTEGLFAPSLWSGEVDPSAIVTLPTDIEEGGRKKKRVLRKMGRALIPHSFKAVAGLYRLFWDVTHDGDGDGYGRITDCDDTAGAAYPNATEQCDGIDNDCDAVVDEDDPGGGGDCQAEGLGICAEGILRCRDGLVECIGRVPEAEICGPNTLDADCDGDAGCEDADCTADPSCVPPPDSFILWHRFKNEQSLTGCKVGELTGQPCCHENETFGPCPNPHTERDIAVTGTESTISLLSIDPPTFESAVTISIYGVQTDNDNGGNGDGRGDEGGRNGTFDPTLKSKFFFRLEGSIRDSITVTPAQIAAEERIDIAVAATSAPQGRYIVYLRAEAENGAAATNEMNIVVGDDTPGSEQ